MLFCLSFWALMNILKVKLFHHTHLLVFFNVDMLSPNICRYEEDYGSMPQFSFMCVPFLMRVSQSSWKWRFSFLLSVSDILPLNQCSGTVHLHKNMEVINFWIIKNKMPDIYDIHVSVISIGMSSIIHELTTSILGVTWLWYSLN